MHQLPARSGVVKNCVRCGKEFVPYKYNPKQKYCTRDCYNVFKSQPPRQCRGCGEHFKLTTKQDRWYCRRECYNNRNGRKHNVNGYVVVSGMTWHPLAVSGGTVYEHRLVLWEKLGCETLECEHECHWCSVTLTWGGTSGIHVDHLDEDRQNNEAVNLVPSCGICNRSRSQVERQQ